MDVRVVLIPSIGSKGPFNLLSDSDNYVIPVLIGVSAEVLTAGVIVSVPDDTQVIMAQSIGNCTNAGIVIINSPDGSPVPTTTYTTTGPCGPFSAIALEGYTTTTTTTYSLTTTTTTTIFKDIKWVGQLSTTRISPRLIDVVWQEATTVFNTISGYNIYSATIEDGVVGDYSIVGSTYYGEERKISVVVEQGTSTVFKVLAYNGSNASVESPTLEVTTPLGPTFTGEIQVSNSATQLSWEKSTGYSGDTSGIDAYEIYFNEDAPISITPSGGTSPFQGYVIPGIYQGTDFSVYVVVLDDSAASSGSLNYVVEDTSPTLNHTN